MDLFLVDLAFFGLTFLFFVLSLCVLILVVDFLFSS